MMAEKKRYVKISVCGDEGVKDTHNDKILFFGITQEVNLLLFYLNKYETELSMEREKVVYWRNKAKDIWGDMRTNVELEKQVRELENIKTKIESRLKHLESVELSNMESERLTSKMELIWVLRLFDGDVE